MVVVDAAGNVSAPVTASILIEQMAEPTPPASPVQPTPQPSTTPSSASRPQAQSPSTQQAQPVSTPIALTPTTEKVILNTFSEYADAAGKIVQMAPAQVVYFEVTIPAQPQAARKPTTQQHSATIATVGVDYVDVTIASTPRTYRLHIGDVKQYDVTEDGTPDIEVALRGITNGIADLRFKQLASAPTPDAVTAKPEVQRNYWWALLFVVPLIIGFAWYKQRHANR